MPLHDFTLATLDELDNGEVNNLFDRGFTRAVQDCAEYPDDTKPRVVQLFALVSPAPKGEDLKLSRVDVVFRVKTSIPVREVLPTRMRIEGGKVQFNDLSPDDPDQGILDGMGG